MTKLGSSKAISVRPFRTHGERLWAAAQVDRIHSQPGSVYIAGIGAQWEEGCWQKVVDMMMAVKKAGLACWLEEILPVMADSAPVTDIGGMREFGVQRGLDAGFEWICLLDSDVLPEPGLLLKLMKRGMPYIGPYIVDPATEQPVGFPAYERGQGVQPMQWIPGSLTLFRASVMNLPSVDWSRMNDEHFFQQFWHYGHRPYVDTDVELRVTTGPRRYYELPWDERWARLKGHYDNRNVTPDRRPINPNDASAIDRVYAPFANGRKEILNDQC